MYHPASIIQLWLKFFSIIQGGLFCLCGLVLGFFPPIYGSAHVPWAAHSWYLNSIWSFSLTEIQCPKENHWSNILEPCFSFFSSRIWSSNFSKASHFSSSFSYNKQSTLSSSDQLLWKEKKLLWITGRLRQKRNVDIYYIFGSLSNRSLFLTIQITAFWDKSWHRMKIIASQLIFHYWLQNYC